MRRGARALAAALLLTGLAAAWPGLPTGAEAVAPPGLPLSATPLSTRVGDNVNFLRLVLRPLGKAHLRQVTITVRDRPGHVVARRRLADPNGRERVVALRLRRGLRAGLYTVRLAGRRDPGGPVLSSTRRLRFAEGGGAVGPAAAGGTLVQRAVVDWYDGRWGGRDLAGFVVPGIGYGEVECRPDAQSISVFPSRFDREVAMMNWTYKDWGTYQEKALREAVYTTGTGPEFSEGLNKFSPAEKVSTGEFQGVISDRGPIGSGGGEALAPPTTLTLTWSWDFSDEAAARCHVEATFETETAESPPPLARSAQVVWHGAENAAANGSATVELPGVGTLALRCQPGQPPRLTVESEQGARIVTRQGSEDASRRQSVGPVETALPNNGMLAVTMDGGARILVASRWKLNDPDPSRNWCAVAAQASPLG